MVSCSFGLIETRATTVLPNSETNFKGSVVVPLNLPILFWDACLRHFPVPGSLNDWRDSVISHLISPRNNPEFPSVWLSRGLRVASQLGANIGLRRASP